MKCAAYKLFICYHYHNHNYHCHRHYNFYNCDNCNYCNFYDYNYYWSIVQCPYFKFNAVEPTDLKSRYFETFLCRLLSSDFL